MYGESYLNMNTPKPIEVSLNTQLNLHRQVKQIEEQVKKLSLYVKYMKGFTTKDQIDQALRISEQAMTSLSEMRIQLKLLLKD